MMPAGHQTFGTGSSRRVRRRGVHAEGARPERSRRSPPERSRTGTGARFVASSLTTVVIRPCYNACMNSVNPAAMDLTLAGRHTNRIYQDLFRTHRCLLQWKEEGNVNNNSKRSRFDVLKRRSSPLCAGDAISRSQPTPSISSSDVLIAFARVSPVLLQTMKISESRRGPMKVAWEKARIGVIAILGVAGRQLVPRSCGPQPSRLLRRQPPGRGDARSARRSKCGFDHRAGICAIPARCLACLQSRQKIPLR